MSPTSRKPSSRVVVPVAGRGASSGAGRGAGRRSAARPGSATPCRPARAAPRSSRAMAVGGAAAAAARNSTPLPLAAERHAGGEREFGDQRTQRLAHRERPASSGSQASASERATAAPRSRPSPPRASARAASNPGRSAGCVSALTPAGAHRPPRRRSPRTPRRGPRRTPRPSASRRRPAPVPAASLGLAGRTIAPRRERDARPGRRRPGRGAPCPAAFISQGRLGRVAEQAADRCRCGSCRATGRAGARC